MKRKKVTYKEQIKELQDFVNNDMPKIIESQRKAIQEFEKLVKGGRLICSGQNNFFCDPVLFNKDGYEVCVLDCADTLNGEYGFENNGNKYVVVIEEK